MSQVKQIVTSQLDRWMTTAAKQRMEYIEVTLPIQQTHRVEDGIPILGYETLPVRFQLTIENHDGKSLLVASIVNSEVTDRFPELRDMRWKRDA